MKKVKKMSLKTIMMSLIGMTSIAVFVITSLLVRAEDSSLTETQILIETISRILQCTN